MSALTLRGTAWVAGRQHRAALWTVLLVTGLVIGCAIAARIWITTEEPVAGCGQRWKQACAAFASAAGWFEWAEKLVAATVVLLPLLVVALTAGPLIARELETGTYRLAWSQSVSPARWLAARLTGAAVLAAGSTALLVVTFLWSRSYTRGDSLTARYWEGGGFAYPAMGVAGVSYAVLAVAVGALAAVLVRRTLLAMGAGAVATAGVAVLLAVVRSHLWPVVSARGTLPEAANNSWVTQQGVILADGSRVTIEQCWDMGFSKSPCAPDTPDVTRFFDYHPAAHFWPLQLVETGIVLAVAAACVFAAFKVLGRQHG